MFDEIYGFQSNRAHGPIFGEKCVQMVPPLAFENLEGCQVKHEHEFVKHEHEFVKHEHEAILCGMNEGLRLPIRVPIWQLNCYKGILL